MLSIRTCAQLVGILGLLVACNEDGETPNKKLRSAAGGNQQTNGEAQAGVQSTLGGEGVQLTTQAEGGTSAASMGALNTEANSSGGYGTGSSVGAGKGDPEGVAGAASSANTLQTAGGAAAIIASGGSPPLGNSGVAGGAAPYSAVGGATMAMFGGSSSVGGTTVSASTVGGTSASGGNGGTTVGGAFAQPDTTVDPALAKSQCSGKPGPSYDEFFDNGRLATLRISIDEPVLEGKAPLDVLWSKWSHCPPHEASDFLPVSFAYESPNGVGSVACERVGMRLRGSRASDSPYTQVRGFKLDMQALDGADTHRRFADLNRINVLSIEMDDKSHMMQCLAYKALREFNIPAPRCNHLKVYINGVYYGLLENVEQPNRGYVRRHFGTNTGFLFAASPSQEDCAGEYAFKDSLAKLNYNGDSFSGYTTQYMLDSATAEDAEKTLIPMIKCGDLTQTPDDAQFKACIQEWIDLDEWLRFVAADSLMPELQSWLGYYRNGYLYFRPDPSAPHGGRFAIWSWDLDTAYNTNTCYPANCDPFKAVDGYYGPRNARSKLITRLTTAFQAEYCTQLKTFLSTVYKPSLVDDMATVIEAGVTGDSHTDPTAWQAAVSALHSFIVTHGAEMQAMVDQKCPVI